MPKSADPVIESDALKANLQETAVPEVTIAPDHQVLADIVREYKGIHHSISDLLIEINHPFRNWSQILPKFRAFILKHNHQYARHQQGPEAFSQFINIHLMAIEQAWENLKHKKNAPAIFHSKSPKSWDTIIALAMESLLAYLEKFIQDLDEQTLLGHQKAFNTAINKIAALDDQVLILLGQGYHPIKKIAAALLAVSQSVENSAVSSIKRKACFDCGPFTTLYAKLLAIDYHYWLREEDPLPWFTTACGHNHDDWDVTSLFAAISHEAMQKNLAALEPKKKSSQANTERLQQLLTLPAHLDLVRIYKDIPAKLLTIPFPNASYPGAGEKQLPSPDPTFCYLDSTIDRFAENRKLLFLFRIMDTPGLFLIHEETLREINRSLVLLIHEQAFEEIEQFLLTTFQLLKANVIKFPHTSLQCIQVLGTEIFKKGSGGLVESFLWEVVRFGFQYANVTGVDQDWQPIANPAHLVNIRVWISLIVQEPKWCSTLFSALIINLHLSGTCIKDTDLFQRDITELLNHPIGPIYNLAKQFAKLLPVFFNEIGAEGELREVSTELDETHRRKDVLIHFLRKQSHVESSNLIVNFIRAIFAFWHSGDKTVLDQFLPPEVLYGIQSTGPFIDDLHILMKRVFELPDIKRVEDLLAWDATRRDNFLAQQADLNPVEMRRFALLVHMYTLLHEKYNLGLQDLRQQLEIAVNSGFPELQELIEALESGDTFECLDAILDHLENLQKIILSPETFEAREDIYYKRHIAVDIPSVYGRYRERKFDAMGLTFRLENLATVYLEKIPETVNTAFITEATFIRIINCLTIYLRALKIDGITSRYLETYVALLSSSVKQKRFSYTQYLDIFRGLSEGVKDIIYAYYTNLHENNLAIIAPQIGAGNLLPRYRILWHEDDLTGSVHRLNESFLRDLIAGTFGLQHLDNFITKIYQTLENQKELLSESNLDLLMTYNPENVISFLHRGNQQTNNVIMLGNKGFNLSLLAADKKPVPPGFIITTEIFRCWPVVKDFFKAKNEFMSQIRQSLSEMEGMTGRKFGDPSNPLLVSVRSGAAVSMPGMMATLHNVGLNEEISAEFAKATGKEYLAWDNYRRFLQSWAMAKGVEREIFQVLMNQAKAKHDVQVKRQFSAEQMRELALNYQKTIRGIGIGIPDDPWLQLTGAIEMVLDSWDTPKTREYRTLMDVSDSWGTAVIIQAMVFGNISTESGSGVLFTAHPYRKVRRVALWGDYATADQGEDIVSGLVTSYPVSIEQAELDGRSKELSLEKRFPQIYQRLRDIARDLVYEKQWNPQDIEFTFEGPEADDLFILQSRDMITIKKKENFDAFVDSLELTKAILGKGIGVSGSALAGRAVFTVAHINRLRQEDPGTPLILIRQDTVPEDIKEISQADGLLTARGGQTSHASLVALRLDKTCIVGCKNLKVYETEERCEIGGHTIRFGDQISIDGRKGLFLRGIHPLKKEVHILPI
ncbi:MAG: PEP/pyruvate-binding domain-containing protein [Desulfobulbaceae bacterium]|nr:PEP/pyruvate-binding domain-containing protein [Desulfobulbaceae bacterium]